MARFVEAGITTLDCADIYTGVETLIGQFLTERRWRLDRYDTGVEVHTKYAPDLNQLSVLSRDDVRRAIDRSRARLSVHALDLVQFHWWDYEIDRFVDVATWLAELHREGVIRHLGATNFDTRALGAMLDAGVPIVSHQVQFSVLDHRPENGMVDLCRARGVQLLCYGTLAGGLLHERWLGVRPPGSQRNRSQVKYSLIIDEAGGWDWFQAVLRVLAEVGRNRATTIGTVAARYVLDKPQVAAVIIGARNTTHLDRTRAITSLTLEPADRARIGAVVAQGTGIPGDVYAIERLKNGRHAQVMRYNLHAGGE
jgi:aryl-alcohol dehydrogenase-like predicted oxidoreductase